MKKEDKFLSEEDMLKLSIPINPFEEQLLKEINSKLGYIATVKEVANFLSLSPSTIYGAIEDEKLFNVNVGKRIFIISPSIIYFLRDL